MGDTEDRRRVRGVLSGRLDSYFEMIMETARRDSDERWERVIQEAATDRGYVIAHAS